MTGSAAPAATSRLASVGVRPQSGRLAALGRALGRTDAQTCHAVAHLAQRQAQAGADAPLLMLQSGLAGLGL
ncbi:MAG TPA: hypothetical protein PK420_12290, partial [Rubrivivax sp.]|nr:hypothetical protein [Rubrivivax sp.]